MLLIDEPVALRSLVTPTQLEFWNASCQRLHLTAECEKFDQLDAILMREHFGGRLVAWTLGSQGPLVLASALPGRAADLQAHVQQLADAGEIDELSEVRFETVPPGSEHAVRIVSPLEYHSPADEPAAATRIVGA